ncbi:NB-ARC domains-containing protein [Artemisia annua]|uniref:NB-ARC domains-containing protein n=1 Tax=Artemisia annua TaxID=35608 RepID=A0A2U1NZM3_ARTAN|nr:NB-ARC domains-containing protein [Artemisia annua]
MTTEVANKLFEDVVDSLLAKAKKEIGYTWNCKENVEKLRSEVGKLKDMTGRVKQRIKSANDKGDELLDGVQKWVDEADAHITMAEEFLQEEADAKKTCFNFWMCVNLNTFHHYGKQATNKFSSLEQHQKDGAAYEGDVSIPTPSPGILELNQRKNYDDLDTHKSALEKIVKSIEDESMQIIGIYGIGGVGKTTLAKEVAAIVNHLFDHVVFVTVSQRVDATKIQKEVEAAAKRIMKGEKILIILDDLWKEQKLDEVGIPSVADHPNFKILLTSRKSRVCEAMNAQRKIHVDSLPINEAWILFKRVVGERVETDAKLKPVAIKVVEGCGGLPLILQAVGNALKNEESITRWKKALDKIEKHATADIDPDIRLAFANLKLSYDYLETEESKSCFLLCSMFPEDFEIPLERLAYYGVGLQFFEDLKSLEDARDSVQNAVELLKSSCLLLDGDDELTTKMHDVVQARKNLTEWEPRIGSLESYTGISLMFNRICKLPGGYELNIPLLKIFLIQGNHRLSEISDEFTQAMKEAKVIDFEYNNISSLPKSLNQLTRLRMLNLGGNRSLRNVSILGELKQLEILILSKTGITEIPQEIGELVKLRLFHVARCRGVLSKLHWLEELSIGYYPVEEGKYNSLVEIGKLSKLTSLNLWVPHIWLIPEGDDLKRLKRFSIRISGEDDSYNGIVSGNRTLILDTPFLDISHLMNVRKLIEVSDDIFLGFIENLNSIIHFVSCEGLGLKFINLFGCANLLCLVDSRVLDEIQTFHPSKTHKGVKENTRFLPKLEELTLFNLRRLKVIWNCPDQYISLNNLVTLEISFCPMLEKLFTISVAQGLVNLQKLRIQRCESLKEVISDGDEESGTGEIDTVVPAKHIVFRRLAEIRLNFILNLTNFYPRYATIKYPSLVEVWIYACDKMEKWGYGTHDTPNLRFLTINGAKENGSTIDEALAKHKEYKLRKEQLRNGRSNSAQAGPSS